MLVSVSPLGIVKSRPGFGHTINPVSGSIIASPALADWNPEPDYFFHWFRDSAVVIDAVRLLFEAGDLGPPALEHFGDFVRFSVGLQSLDGRKVIANDGLAGGCYSRTSSGSCAGTMSWKPFLDEAIVAETRVNPGRHARHLELEPPPTRWRAVARTLGVEVGPRTRQFDSELRPSWLPGWYGPTSSLRLHTGASPPLTSGRRKVVCTTTLCVFQPPPCRRRVLIGWNEAGETGLARNLSHRGGGHSPRSRWLLAARGAALPVPGAGFRSAFHERPGYRGDPRCHSCVG